MKKINLFLICLMFSLCLVSCDKCNNITGTDKSNDITGTDKSNNITGTFYILKEAYEQNLISKEDLKNIAYYYNELVDNDFVPTPKDPKVLDECTEKIIKKMYLKKILEEEQSIDGVIIYRYYGTYNGHIALDITDNYHLYDYVVYGEYVIDGVSFYHFAEPDIRIFVFEE